MQQCVSVGSVAGTPAVVPDDTCTAGLVLVDASQASAMAVNPLLLPLEATGPMALATLGLFVVAFIVRALRAVL